MRVHTGIQEMLKELPLSLLQAMFIIRPYDIPQYLLSTERPLLPSAALNLWIRPSYTRANRPTV